eukprot:CAMPEP_0115368388 /NCGR_PEP_ID=MMETSP0270-20121206/105793_1 /TAXON_ID=71861 /ORGANISM="Scrippsiella trochoidea, Strain CCMP3099" /LENGTH=78 /DNA_ID=CAMNT_0002791185 /DNA_START=479 /DNA_END=715 /DNA_ORIENTATION=-
MWIDVLFAFAKSQTLWAVSWPAASSPASLNGGSTGHLVLSLCPPGPSPIGIDGVCTLSMPNNRKDLSGKLPLLPPGED